MRFRLGAIGVFEVCCRSAGATDLFLEKGTAIDVVAGLRAQCHGPPTTLESDGIAAKLDREPLIAALLAVAIRMSYGRDKGALIGAQGVAAAAVGILDTAASPSVRLRILGAMLLHVQCLNESSILRVVQCGGGAALLKLVDDDEAIPVKVCSCSSLRGCHQLGLHRDSAEVTALCRSTDAVSPAPCRRFDVLPFSPRNGATGGWVCMCALVHEAFPLRCNHSDCHND